MNKKDSTIKKVNNVKKEKIISGTLYINGSAGFVKPDSEYEEEFREIYISPDKMGRAFDGDRVVVCVNITGSFGKNLEGSIESVTKQGQRKFAGVVKNIGGNNIFIPDGKKRKVFEKAIIKGDIKNAGDGSIVTFTIDEYNVRTQFFAGHIEEVFGIDQSGADITAILAGYGIYGEFPEDVTAELEKIPDRVTGQTVAAKIKKGRMDFRELTTVTIDSEDTKDVDDAISLTVNTEENFVLGVHIADVTEYVTEGSALDNEAYARGTSVYPVDRVVPMLPPKLSNGICSLNVGENRLALSVILVYDREGNLLKSSIYESVIKVDNKITYNQIYSLLENKEYKVYYPKELKETYSNMTEMFENMRILAGLLQKKRREDGALTFDFPEIKVVLDKNGEPIEIGKYETTFANNIIEEFMVAANKAVAEYFCTKKIPFMYRVHEEPEREKIERLAEAVKAAGGKAYLPRGPITPRTVSAMLDSVKGLPCEESIQYLSLRSLQKAEYMDECKGHFGLAAEFYTHFTSPIRRYPDLFIHRIIKKVLRGELNPNAKRHFEEIKGEAAENCSINERRAAEAELTIKDYKVIQYMEKFVGKTFEGVISSVTGFGFYVRLDNLAEGLVHYNSVSDYMEFDEIHMCARGQRTGICFKTGDKVKIKVEKADPKARMLDFVLCDTKGAASGKFHGKMDKNGKADFKSSSKYSSHESKHDSKSNSKRDTKKYSGKYSDEDFDEYYSSSRKSGRKTSGYVVSRVSKSKSSMKKYTRK